MKEQMRHLYKLMLVITALMLQACGSSGDQSVFSISTDITTASFSHELSQESNDSVAIQVDFSGDGLLVGFAPDTDPVAWLEYRTENVTDNSATIFLDVINAQFLLQGTHTAKIRIATSNEDGSKFASQDIDVSLFVSPKIKFSATFGATSIPAQTIPVTSESNEWTATTDVDWLSLAVTSGTEEGAIVVTPNISSFSEAGLHQGKIIITDEISGERKSISVDLALDQVYLFAERPAVALTSTANISAVATTIAIGHNGEQAISWQATTAANWLTVTPLNDTQLQITADPSIAPLNANSSAQIIVSASQDSAVISETIKVNFYNSDLVVENKVLSGVAINNNEMVASPLKPVFYVGVDNNLLSYHQYTGEVESALVVSPENTQLVQLIMHPTGDYLLAKAIETVTAEDESTSELVHRYKINLMENTVTEILDADILFEPTDIVHLLGRYFVVTQTLEFADENLKRVFWDSDNVYFASEIDVAAQTNTLFALDNTTVSFKRYTLQVNDFGDDSITTTLTHEYHPESLLEGQFVRDFIVAKDEKNIYVISETSQWISFDGETFVDNGLLETSDNVVTLLLEKNNESQANYLRIDTTNTLGFYLDSYNEQQGIASTTYTQGGLPSSIKLSGDNQRLLINIDSANNPGLDSQLALVSLAQ